MPWRYADWEVESIEFRYTPLELMKGDGLPVRPPSLVEVPGFPGRRHVQVKLGTEVVAELIWTTGKLEATEAEHVLGLLVDAVAPKSAKPSLLP